MNYPFKLQGFNLYAIVVLRLLIGWYFLYEGIMKLLNPNWSAFGYLITAKGLFSDFFIGLAENPVKVSVVNHLNIWGLIAVGSGLILGAFSKIACVAGALLLLLYYLAHPPLVDMEYLSGISENTLWVDKNLIFIAVLIVLYAFPTSRIIGIDRILFSKADQG